MSKVNPKSLKCIFLGYSRVQKGCKCYFPSFRRCPVSADVTFLENASFSQDLIHPSQGEDDDLLVYTLAFPALVSEPPLTKPPITHVYTWRQHPQSQALHQLLQPQIQFSLLSDDLPIVLRKGKR